MLQDHFFFFFQHVLPTLFEPWKGFTGRLFISMGGVLQQHSQFLVHTYSRCINCLTTLSYTESILRLREERLT